MKKRKKVVKSSIVNVSKNSASKVSKGIFNRSVFAKGDSWSVHD